MNTTQRSCRDFLHLLAHARFWLLLRLSCLLHTSGVPLRRGTFGSAFYSRCMASVTNHSSDYLYSSKDDMIEVVSATITCVEEGSL